MKIYVDGHLDGPNKMVDVGYSKIILDDDVKKETKVFTYIKKNLTNNEAELMALAHGLTFAHKFDSIYSDSEWCILAVEGAYNVKEPRLQLMVSFLRSMVKKKAIRLMFCKRELNLAT